MEIEVYCPDCGYCSYDAIEKKTGRAVKLVIAKCDENTCDFSVHDENDDLLESNQVNDFDLLKTDVHSRFDVLSHNDCNC